MTLPLLVRKRREQKRVVVESLREHIIAAEGLLLMNFEGVCVADDLKFRRRMQDLGVKVQVVKNTLARRAFADTPFGGFLEEYLRQPTMLLIVREDLPRVARELKEILGLGDIPFVLKGGALPGKVFGPEALKDLAALPTRREIIYRLASGLRSPMARLTHTLSAPLNRLLYALEVLKQKKQP